MHKKLLRLLNPYSIDPAMTTYDSHGVDHLSDISLLLLNEGSNILSLQYYPYDIISFL